MKIKKFSLSILILLLWQPVNAFAISSFPGAEGFGANSLGGRGGQVIKVTNLNDSGPGSFREAVDASGPRIVVFEVSGIINLQSELNILSPYLTIAGQTSPGGILITGRRTKFYGEHTIVQHLRFRVGSHNVVDAEKHDAVNIYGPGNTGDHYGHDMIFDHCSFSWGIDETFSTAYNPQNITIQWCVVSEGLSHAGHPKGEHSKGFFIWGVGSPDTKVSLHHNYIAHNTARGPEINGDNGTTFLDAVNNVVYNWGDGRSMSSGGDVLVNWQHNYARKGASSIDYSFEARHSPISTTITPIIYLEGNIGSNRLSQSDPQWSIGYSWTNELLNEGYRRSDPWPAPPVTKAVMSDDVANCILSAVGATAPVRDSVDTRVTNDFINVTGDIIDNVTYPDDFPTFQTPAPPADVDNDGIADNWETANGLIVGTNDSAGDKDSDGYTNIEEYLHYLSEKSYTYNAACMPLNESAPLPTINKIY